jgi:hypothetical protein
MIKLSDSKVGYSMREEGAPKGGGSENH